ncbi:MAG: tetratricopeptide repeat protein [Pseudomonadota bacterium]|nr:tetratricopeptide repeat protein [Pseudomonadota bacterium]
MVPSPIQPRLEQQLNQALSLHQQGKLAGALELYRLVLKAEPNNITALQYMGILYGQTGRFEEALTAFSQACAVQPDDFSMHYNRGKALQELHRYEQALESYNRTLSLNASYIDGYNNRGIVLSKLRRDQESLTNYDAALLLNPGFAAAHINRGSVLTEMKRYREALVSFDQALSIDSTLAEAFNNRGLVLAALARSDEALANYDRAIALHPDYAAAYKNRADLLVEMRRHDEALTSYNRAIALDPNQPYLHGSRLHAQMAIGDWHDFEARVNEISGQIKQGNAAAAPFGLMATPIDAATLKRAAELCTAEQYPPAAEPLWSAERQPHERIRIGYFSADFHNHATAHLMVQMFERHAPARFETFAFSFGPPSDDPLRQRLIDAFDHFFDVKDEGDQAIAELAQQQQIDIAVDLKGYTQESRPAIFARRPAPIQVSYLGFPGTMGALYIDYIIADAVVIPTDHFDFYSEKVVQLPHCYQVNDSQRPIAPATPTRQMLGLPEAGFVFCCFNNNFKITPDLFTIWMGLLAQVQGSVLWLYEGSQAICPQLRRAAEQRGIDPARLIFAPRLPLAQHLARHRQADLFLDTFYYNAHTTSSDALWAGLPLLTCIGNTFASRVAASLLQALDLPELISHSHDEYAALALTLATEPEMLANLKAKLAHNRLIQPLFNTELFTRHIEAAYSAMWQRHQAGLAAEHLLIPQ